MKNLTVALILAGCFLPGPVTGQAQNPFDDYQTIQGISPLVVDTPSEMVVPIANQVEPPSQVPEATANTSTLEGPKSVYRVKSGDFLSQIARETLGDPKKFWEIIELNSERYPSLRKNPNLILVGRELIIPGSKGESFVNSPSSVTESEAKPTETNGNAIAASDADQPLIPIGPISSATTSPNSPATTTSAGNPSTQANANGSSGNSVATSADKPLLKPGTRVLHIGDSHTVGIYGGEMDKLMRETGAQVQTYGVSGSSPSWWWNNTTTKCGYFSRDEKGKTDRPADWRTPRQTPNLEKLIKEFRPEVLVVSQGANMTGASEKSIEADTRRLLEIAKANGTKIVWVGPPNGRDTPTRVQQKEKVCQTISRLVSEYGGTFIDSRTCTTYPASGGDGLHFWGNEGKKTAEGWANQVIDDIQGKP